MRKFHIVFVIFSNEEPEYIFSVYRKATDLDAAFLIACKLMHERFEHKSNDIVINISTV